MQEYGKPLPFTPWHRLEVRNAIRLAVWQREIQSFQAKAQLRQIDTDLREETLLVHANIDWIDVLRAAEKLSAVHATNLGCRSYDIFHVAAALWMRAKNFATLDARQRTMANAVGLTVLP